MKKAFKYFLLVVFLCSMLTACPSPDNKREDSSTGPKVKSISITPSSPSMLVGGNMNLKVERTLEDNTVEDLTNYTEVVWSTSNEAVVSLGNMGIIHARGEGAATITASYRGQKGSANVSVTGLSKKLILYFTTTEDTSQYIPGQGTIEGNVQKLIRYVPDVGIMDIIGSMQSYSYGAWDIVPYTVDNRLFIRQESDTAHIVAELDPLTQQSLSSFRVGQECNKRHGCTAIVGYDYFYGYVSGPFMKLTLPPASSNDLGTTLITGYQYDSCRGNLAADNGVLYDADYFEENSTTYLEIYQRDIGTGKIITAASKSWSFTSPELYNNAMFAFDNGYAYFLNTRKSDGQVEIFQSDFVSDTPTLIYAGIFPDLNPGFGVGYFVASNGYLAIGSPNGSQEVMIIEVSTGATRMIDLGIKNYNNLQILYMR